MKVSQYESYFRNLDSNHTKHQTDYQDVIVPIFNKFIASFIEAGARNDKVVENKATSLFIHKISNIKRDGFQELTQIESETNSLRLTASDELAKLLDDFKELYNQ